MIQMLFAMLIGHALTLSLTHLAAAIIGACIGMHRL